MLKYQLNGNFKTCAKLPLSALTTNLVAIIWKVEEKLILIKVY